MPEIVTYDSQVLLVGGADIDTGILQPYRNLPLVAADGGANHLRRLNWLPSVVLGDLDSLHDRTYWENHTRVIEISEQDTTDFEKCLYSIDAPLYIAAGFCGGRLDHTLATLHVVQKYHRQKSVVLISEQDVIVVCSDTVDLALPVGTRVSVYPLTTVGFESSEGLQYSLNGLTLQSGHFIGTSNISSEPNVKIVPADSKGEFAVLLPVEQLDNLVNNFPRRA